MRDTSHDLARVPSSTRELLLGAMPGGMAPIRLSLADTPERDRPGIYREFFGRSVFRLDVEPLRDVPFDADFTVQNLSDLMVLFGRVHGSCNRRTRAMLSDGFDHCSLMINLGGDYIISQGDRDLTLGDGDATFVCAAEPTSFTHYPPGEVLALKVPHGALMPMVADMEDCYLRRIPAGTPALRLLRDYVDLL